MKNLQMGHRFPIPLLKGILILMVGLGWFFSVFLPQPAILAVMNTDPLMAIYLFLEHGILDACFILAAFYFMTAVLQRRATPTDLALVQFPFLDEMPSGVGRALVNMLLFLTASLALVIIAVFLLLIAQGPWERLVQLTFGLTAPANDWSLPGLLTLKPFSFLVEILVLCLLAPLVEEILFRAFLFQCLARRFNLWAGVLLKI